VKFFRHYRTKNLVFPKPPKKFIDKWKTYQERKRKNSKRAA